MRPPPDQHCRQPSSAANLPIVLCQPRRPRGLALRRRGPWLCPLEPVRWSEHSEIRRCNQLRHQRRIVRCSRRPRSRRHRHRHRHRRCRQIRPTATYNAALLGSRVEDHPDRTPSPDPPPRSQARPRTVPPPLRTPRRPTQPSPTPRLHIPRRTRPPRSPLLRPARSLHRSRPRCRNDFCNSWQAACNALLPHCRCRSSRWPTRSPVAAR